MGDEDEGLEDAVDGQYDDSSYQLAAATQDDSAPAADGSAAVDAAQSASDQTDAYLGAGDESGDPLPFD